MSVVNIYIQTITIESLIKINGGMSVRQKNLNFLKYNLSLYFVYEKVHIEKAFFLIGST